MRLRKNHSKLGLTLIELLVVIAITALILAVLVPALAIAKERARRTVCLANIHQFILGLHVYADENNYHLPSSQTNNTFLLLMVDYDKIAESTGDDRTMFCPSLGEPFIRKSSGVTGGYAWGNDAHYIGYNYLGGHKNTPWPLVPPATTEWKSILKNNSRSSEPLITELNAWSGTFNKTVSPHGKRGAIRQSGDYMNTGLGGISSEQIGADGGNLGFIDGSGHWKHVEKTVVYVISNGGQGREWLSFW